MSMDLFLIFLYYPFYVHGISSNDLFISHFSNVCLFYSWLAWLKVYQFYWYFSEPAYILLIFLLISSFQFHWFYYNLIISLLLLAFSLHCSSFSVFLRWKFVLLTLDFSPFLIYSFSTINISLNAAFAGSHKFYQFYFYLHLIQNIFKFSWDFFLNLLILFFE